MSMMNGKKTIQVLAILGKLILFGSVLPMMFCIVFYKASENNLAMFALLVLIFILFLKTGFFNSDGFESEGNKIIKILNKIAAKLLLILVVLALVLFFYFNVLKGWLI